MEWRQIANAPWIWFSGLVLVVIALYQCTYFALRAVRLLKASGVPNDAVKKIIRASVITGFGPVMALIFVMFALVAAISPGFAWLREGAAVGAVTTELIQASNAAAGVGQEMGTPAFNEIGFAAVVWVTNIICIGWLVAAMFSRHLQSLREKIGGGDARWLAVISICATLGAFGYWTTTHLLRRGPFAVSVVVAMGLSAGLYSAADYFKRPGLKEWALGLALFGGMIAGKLYAG